MLDVDIEHVEAGGFGDLRDLDAAHQACRHRGRDLVARQLLLHSVTNDFFCLHNSLAWFLNAIAARVASMAEDGTILSSSAPTPIPRFPIRPNASRRKIDLQKLPDIRRIFLTRRPLPSAPILAITAAHATPN